MKFALVIPDGCADEPQDTLGGRTPLQAAHIPGMDRAALTGCVGRAVTVPESLPPGSDVGTMSLFGYDPLKFHTGRAPIEAAAQGITLSPGDWAIRCNLVTVNDGCMESFTAHQVPSSDGRELIELLQKELCGDRSWKFHAGVSYRNLLLYRSRETDAPFSRETTSTPPHDITDQPVAKHLPDGPGADALRELMARSEELFADCDVNRRRQERGLAPVTGIWLWGLGQRPNLQPFAERYGQRGAVITAVDLLRGLGRLVGMQIIDVPGATGYLDTDYAAKGRAAIDVLQSEADFVVVHVEATDEASHEGDAAAKVEALQQIDLHIVQPLHAWLEEQGEYRLLITPDHPTFLRTKTHSHGAVPFAICGRNIVADSATAYSEQVANAGSLECAGHDLMTRLFAKIETGWRAGQ